MISLRPGVRLVLLATFLFAIMQIGVKTLPRLSSPQIVFFRSLVVLAICLVMIKRRKLPVFGHNKILLIARGLCGSVALILFFYTLKNTPLATAVTFQYLSPIFTILFAMFIMKEFTTWYRWIAFLVALSGVVLVKGFDPRISIIEMGAGITSAMFSGLAYNFIRKLKDYDDPLTVVMYFPLITIPVVIPFMFNNWIWPNAQEWLILVFIGTSTQIAQWAMTKSLQLERASDITIFKYLGIIYALAFGYFFFGEMLSWLSIVGIFIVITGVYLGSRGTPAEPSIRPSG